MIITKLKGGLGNQMFQYAIARSLSSKNTVYLDLSFLKNNNTSSVHFTKRDFELGIFPVSYKISLDKEREAFFSKSFKNRILRKFLYGNLTHITQSENEIVNIPPSKNIYLDGYFQSEKYFAHIRDILLADFTFPDLDAENKIVQKKINTTENTVSIHLRRGDYLKPDVQKYHGSLPSEYYLEAINFLEENFENCSFFVFSDDISYCKEIFKNIKNIEYIDHNHGNNSWKDMYLMTQCRHHIIANSSFSWWGAWLGQKDGKTIAPKNWFNKEVANFDIQDIIPQKWITI